MTNTKSQTAAADIAALLRARNPLIIVTTREEARVERYLVEAAAAAGYVPRTWDIAQGVADLSGKIENADVADPDAVLALIRSRADGGTAQRGVWILRDALPWLSGPVGAATQRRLRNLARQLPGVPRDRAQAVIILTTGGDIPAELSAHATIVDWPLPDREEIAAELDAAIANLPEELRDAAAPNGARDAAIDAAVGLSGEEAAACYSRSLIQHRRIDVATVNAEKRRVITRERVLEWLDPLPGGLDWVGGLENLKEWLLSRTKAYTPAARAYGLPAPKGILVVGIPGCGKTLLSKAVAAARKVPLVKLDLGGLKSKFVGESEAQLRKALKTIEALGPCVVLVDEIEKSLQGATSGSADGGVSSDALGTVLSWLQDRTSEAFVIATANDVTALPPELLRKGRFDELWFVDLPNQIERKAVLHAAIRQKKRDPDALTIDSELIADACEGFTGSEIASLIDDALFTAFSDNGREIETKDILAAARTVTPLSKTADAKVKALKDWGATRARAATATLKAVETKAARVLDIA